MVKFMSTEFISVRQAAKIKGVSTQALYLAIRLKKLKAYKSGDYYKIFLSDLDIYDKKKYSRESSLYDGELVFDEKNGQISVAKASVLTGLPRQKLYHAMRTKNLPFILKGRFYVLHMDDLLKYHDDLEKKNGS